MSKLANADEQLTFRVKVMGERREYGYIETSVSKLQDKRDYEVIQPNNQSNERFRVMFKQFEVVTRPSFVDYLRSGWQISLSVAIDFTASNGQPTQPSSLHFMGPNNQYEQAISSVGSILEPYDSDKMFACFGFGGIPRHMGFNEVSHCFPLHGNS